MNIHRPPAPADHAENFPHLRICPHCGLDLRERPERGQCPECTIEYDERTWSIPCWTDISATRSSTWPLALLVIAALGSLLLPFGFLPSILLIAIFIGRLIAFNPRLPQNAALIAWPDGFSIRVRRSHRMVTIPWDEVAEVIVREPCDDADDESWLPIILWPAIAFWNAMMPQRDLLDAHEIALRRRPTGRGPALAEVVIIEGTDALAQSVQEATEQRITAANVEPAAGRAAADSG